MKTKVLLLNLMITLVLPAPSFSQPGGLEGRLLRENRRLQAKVDSLQRLLDSAMAVDGLWGSLEGLDGQDDGWGYGVSVLGDGSLSEEDRLLAGRIAALFPEMAVPYHPSVRRRMEAYLLGRNARILSAAEGRLRRRMPYFREVFARHGVPSELIPLCVVESAVSANAVSPVGAAGMWQLMPRTAEDYGLLVDGRNDERFSVEKSTEAAAGVLRDLRRELGSWPLAVMAYNCGAARVRKAAMAAGTTEVWAVWERVPKETRDYLPSLLAVGCLMER